MRRHRLVGKALPIFKHKRSNNGGDASVDMHHCSTGEIAEAARIEPAVGRPNPVRHRKIDDEGPGNRKQQHRRKAHTLGETTDDQRRRDDCERQLEHRKHAVRNRAVDCVDTGVRKKGVRETANESAGSGVAEGHRVTDREPQDADRATDRETLHQYR